MGHVLEVGHLSVQFGRTTVLRDLSFHVVRGTSLAILGPNASGKTVLFRALIGAIPFDGTVQWAPGTRIGYVPQKLDLERDVPITVIVFIIGQRNRLIVMLVSPDVARTAGINVRRLNLLYLQLFALTIALGLRYLGVLLMGALIIIPAATAKRLARNLTGMLVTAVLVAVLATVVGSSVAAWLDRETGPIIVTVATGCFVLSLMRRQS